MSHSTDDDGSTPDPTNCKVGRLIAEYDLRGFGDELEARWTGERGERESLRDLMATFNERLLRAAMEDAGLSPLDSEVASKYEALTDDDVSSGVRTETTRDLERNGVDVDALETDFVTHQAIHTYLTKYRDAELERPDDAERVSKALETVQRLRSRLLAVTENVLSRLRNAGVLSTGDLEVLVDVRVTCTDCGERYDVATLLSEGGCACSDADE
ncbi:MAG: rod-determining factor RdfA [Haloplanus sp.]